MRRFVIFIIILVVFFGFLGNFGFAKNFEDQEDLDIPERDGVYDVPGNPKLKVRVFVHNPKPTPAENPLLVCNLSDPDSNVTVGATGWHLPSGTWTYRLNPSSAPSLVSSNLTNIASYAFAAWSATSIGSKVNFVDGGTTYVYQKAYDGKNIIAWGRTSGSALAVTYTWYYPSTGLVAEGETIMNKKFPWSWSPYSTTCANSNTYDAQDILTHELGHWLGLDDKYTSPYLNNTMYGYGSKGEIKKETLTSGDIKC